MWSHEALRGALELRVPETPNTEGAWHPFRVADHHIGVGTRLRCVVGEGVVAWADTISALGRVNGHITDLQLSSGSVWYFPDYQEVWERLIQFRLTWDNR